LHLNLLWVPKTIARLIVMNAWVRTGHHDPGDACAAAEPVISIEKTADGG
jgi:hypothetical protein